MFPTIDEMKSLCSPVAYVFRHADGLKSSIMLMNGLVEDFNFAARCCVPAGALLRAAAERRGLLGEDGGREAGHLTVSLERIDGLIRSPDAPIFPPHGHPSVEVAVPIPVLP